MTHAFEMAPIPDREQKQMVVAELLTWQCALAEGWLTSEGMQALNHRLREVNDPPSKVDIETTAVRHAVLDLLWEKLSATTGFPVSYFAELHRPDVPDDLSGLDGA